jgi:peptidoglycan-N-acetylglucosamine deacetylase
VDSLDWNAHVGAEEVAGRVVALMLIKRHGVLLFHDIHSKAAVALRVIFNRVGGIVDWGECRRLM